MGGQRRAPLNNLVAWIKVGRRKVMMACITPPSSFHMSGNIAKNQRNFRQVFQLYLPCIGAEGKPEQVQPSLFLLMAAEEACEIYNHFQFAEDEQIRFSAITAKCEEC